MVKSLCSGRFFEKFDDPFVPEKTPAGGPSGRGLNLLDYDQQLRKHVVGIRLEVGK